MPIVAVDDIAAQVSGYGPCQPWTAVLACDTDTVEAAVLTRAIAAASEILHALSGRQFGLCELTLRPCREECADGPWQPWPGWSWPYPTLDTGRWYNYACGTCAGSCSCAALSEVLLPAPVHEVLAVKVDGTTLAPSAYRLDDARRLVRVDGEVWPGCNNLNLADTADGTWSVTASYGQPVPTLGTLAAGELACSLLPAVQGQDCPLPANITQLVRQGVTVTMPDYSEVLRNGGLGLRLADLFIATYNPAGLPARSRVYSVDRPAHRRVGTG